MGFDSKHVKSDNYSHFECAICQNLVDLDCLLTVPCSHCFCRICFTKWIESAADNNNKRCPKCNASLESTASVGNQQGLIVAGGQRMLVQPMEENAMAHRILKTTKVGCPFGPTACQWEGDYGDVKNHLLNTEQHPDIASVFATSSSVQRKVVVVYGGGSKLVNGVYHQDGISQGYTKYSKLCTWDGESRVITISVARAALNKLRRFISILDKELPGTDRDIDFYASCNMDSGKAPALTGWETKENGALPVPTLGLFSTS